MSAAGTVTVTERAYVVAQIGSDHYSRVVFSGAAESSTADGVVASADWLMDGECRDIPALENARFESMAHARMCLEICAALVLNANAAEVTE